ncbi:MAG: dTDP-4-dehydrorhamnose reductase [Limnospira sp. PMC 1291.21]|uniref:dTDP-4-dehydrorhamnose reductase n=1 Tax=Limnospira fusiformis PMC 851.14 TaxID=2219512 RepID=A0ABU9EF04_LIMFS|nr:MULTISPECIES: dTDP-4-dehydrorhamnose reductase [unclassified Limnospira]MDT9177603.1 dTDP-4-dehydrorhamnose reductase [Limnospira sp. PMC 1238.20]MDT9187808.1 dTDP-4-dehydrorhamnose reductase [Limnospira sp. PMC 894.15]MDT9192859.1 dTDP-4-dehydrorhamnose reductase [Limnospira sp. PMC 1245.20]MDT9203202.1 dTDP-4-dehydrorhamnose reductase [Limnospira sp. PMC 1243.20]MDT9208342.1 dTDP-4-dehydrorhamnose reductase [Limnospira sp. PMC 1252.20]
MRILLTGKNGQLGSELQPLLTPLGEVFAVGRDTLDLAKPDAISSLMAEIKPHIVVNAAAYTAVDKAETETDLATAINGIAPGILAAESQRINAKLIHVSTDYVFDGTQSHPYVETDPTNPLGQYGASKLAGEQAILATDANYAIIRTAWVYGAGGTGNFVKTMLRLGGEREELKVVMDQVGTPTWTGDLATAIVRLIPQLNSETSGIYHYTNSGVTSWYDFAIAIFEEAKLLGLPLKIQQVIPITTAEYPTPARRPAYSVLNGKKLATLLGNHPPQWRSGLRTMLKTLVNQG